MANLPYDAQWKRRGSLLLLPKREVLDANDARAQAGQAQQALDLSQFHFTFRTQQADLPSPNNCEIRVFNLSESTMRQVRGEYSEVVLQAGYANGNFGVVFRGTVRHYRIGKLDAKTSYLDILASDGELGYNNAIVSTSLSRGATVQEQLDAIMAGFKQWGIELGYNGMNPGDAMALMRGKVNFGLARVALNSVAQTTGTTWSIQDGRINILPLDGYLPGQAVVLNRDTGLIGRPEQTAEGVRVRCLLNPKILPGKLVQIDQSSVNRQVVAGGNPSNLAYNSNTRPQFLPSVTADGLYRVFVSEHSGDIRGTPWYTDLVCLAANRMTLKVKPYG